MQQLISPATFEFFARSLLAGYVVIRVVSYFIVGARPKVAELVIEAVILSLINQLFFRTMQGVLAQFGWVPDLPNNFALVVEVLVCPTVLGIAVGLPLARGWNARLFRRLSLPAAHPVQRGYDYAFGQQRAPGFVIVSFDDGTVVRGYFGEQSLAASDAERSDLFLERLYSEEQDGQWSELDPGRSGLISLKGVRSIEFLDNAKR